VRSLGCGIVQFGSVEDAARAIAQFNETDLEGRRIRCRENRGEKAGMGAAPLASGSASASGSRNAVKGSPGGGSSFKTAGGGAGAGAGTSDGDAVRVLEPTKIFVTSLSWLTTVEGLVTFFSQAGTVVNATVLSSKKGGRSLGHGIVEFQDAAAAKMAIDTLNKQDLDGRIIVVREYYLT
jgi:RNA recognition motif-containing protein